MLVINKSITVSVQTATRVAVSVKMANALDSRIEVKSAFAGEGLRTSILVSSNDNSEPISIQVFQETVKMIKKFT